MSFSIFFSNSSKRYGREIAMAVCQHFHAIAMDGKRYGGSRKPGIFKNGRRYGRFNSMAESAKSLWTKIRYGERQCFPDLRYGRFDISLWTPDLKGGVKPQWHGRSWSTQ